MTRDGAFAGTVQRRMWRRTTRRSRRPRLRMQRPADRWAHRSVSHAAAWAVKSAGMRLSLSREKKQKKAAPFPGPLSCLRLQDSEALHVLHVHVTGVRDVVLRVERVREGLRGERRVLLEDVVHAQLDRAV